MTPRPVSRRGLEELRVLVRGAGEMATGIACRLFCSGFRVAMTEREHPTAVRRAVAFSEAVWEGAWEVEGTRARLAGVVASFDDVVERAEIPLAVDPELRCLEPWNPEVLIDATIAKRNLGIRRGMAEWVIGFGPGFTAGVDADVVVETNRGHDLGRLIFEGAAQPDTGVPAPVLGFAEERVLRAPCRGVFRATRDIGASVMPGQVLGDVDGEPVRNRVRGVLRGLLRDGVEVDCGQKIGDVDPRGERRLCFTISDKARALGGSALEAILMRFNR